MFGLPSPSKLLVLVLVVGVVWFGFKWLGQRQSRAGEAPPSPKESGRIDTVACPTCGTYTDAAKGTFCGGETCANKP